MRIRDKIKRLEKILRLKSGYKLPDVSYKMIEKYMADKFKKIPKNLSPEEEEKRIKEIVEDIRKKGWAVPFILGYFKNQNKDMKPKK